MDLSLLPQQSFKFPNNATAMIVDYVDETFSLKKSFRSYDIKINRFAMVNLFIIYKVSEYLIQIRSEISCNG